MNLKFLFFYFYFKNFIIFSSYNLNKIYFYLIVLKIIIKKCIEEKINNQSTNTENIDNITKDNWLDIEQFVFNIVNNLLNKKPLKNNYIPIYFHCAHLYELLSSQANKIDGNIDLEKNLIKIDECIKNMKNPQEINVFKNETIKMLAKIFNKINTNITSIEKITSIIDLIISPCLDNKEMLNVTFDKLKNSIKSLRSGFYKTNEKIDSEFTEREENQTLQRGIISMRENLECFFNYILRFSKDITYGKKIWFILENQIIKKTNSEKITNRMIDLVILYTLGKCRYLKIKNDENIKKQIILCISTIMEFVSDKFYNSKIVIPMDKNDYIENHSVNLFTDLICDNIDLLPYNFISSESFIEVKNFKKKFL